MSDTILVTELVPAADDVLIVRGTVNGVPIEAEGWQSALVNHYDPEQYEDVGEEGRLNPKKSPAVMGHHLKPEAKPRAMTSDEARAYAERLLLNEAISAGIAQPTPTAAVKKVLKAVTLDQPPQKAKAGA